MPLLPGETWLLGWSVVTSVWAFGLFGFDKARSRRSGARRVSEFTLCATSALGGWPGGLLGLSFFRHKSAKPVFLFKFFVAFLGWAAFLLGALKLTGRW
jgi:uncharacterized membrane protein YsdA (DUF1294 family)